MNCSSILASARSRARAAGLVVVAALLAIPVVVSMPVGAAGAAPLPADPNQQGYIGFCNETGHNVTGGTINSAPFVWKAVASTPPPAAYLGRGENAVLNVYQPRPATGPADWNGDSLTAASYFSTPKHPAVQATYSDLPLSVIVHEFPPEVDGMYQLRMYFGRTDYGDYSATYPATTIRVVGNTWSVVSGGRVDCGRAASVSNEALTGVVSRRETTPHKIAAPVVAPRPTTGTNDVSAAATPGAANASSPSSSSAAKPGGAVASPGASAGARPSSIGASPVAATHNSTASGSTGHGVVWGVVGGFLAAIVLGAAVLLFLRTRRGTAPAG